MQRNIDGLSVSDWPPGQLVGVFSDFYDPASGDTRDAFLAKVDKNA